MITVYTDIVDSEYKFGVEVESLPSILAMRKFFEDYGWDYRYNYRPDYRFVMIGEGIPRKGKISRRRNEVRFRSEDIALAFYGRYGKNNI